MFTIFLLWGKTIECVDLCENYDMLCVCWIYDWNFTSVNGKQTRWSYVTQMCQAACEATYSYNCNCSSLKFNQIQFIAKMVCFESVMLLKINLGFYYNLFKITTYVPSKCQNLAFNSNALRKSVNKILMTSFTAIDHIFTCTMKSDFSIKPILLGGAVDRWCPGS